MIHRFTPILASGLEFGWQQSTPVGRAFCAALALLSVISWIVVLSKLALLRKARRANAEFLAVLRSAPHPLSLFQNGERFEFAPCFHIYYAAARELAFHMLGTDLPDRTFAARLQGAGRIRPSQMEAVRVAMERAVAETALKFEQKLGLVSIALTAVPFIGLLGTVWGILDTFAGLAGVEKAVTLQALAPGVCAALLTIVAGLAIAVPGMFGYNLLVGRVRLMAVRLENFASELFSSLDRHFVDHRAQAPELPSLGALGMPGTTVTAKPAAASATRTMPPPSTASPARA
jgi:biopolymer transport protein ExbB/TolQ